MGSDTPTSRSLTFLSDLSSDNRATLREMWPSFHVGRRRHIISDLVTMAEDNIELDFRHVFLFGLEDWDEQVRFSAIEGLYEDESRLLLGRLITIVRNDPDERVREAAAKALGRFTYLAQCDKLGSPSDKLRSVLLESARDTQEKPDVRRRAVEALGYLDGDADVQDLIRDTYERGGVQAESAVFAMGRSMDALWNKIVLGELGSEQAAMRYEAARAAGEMVLEDAIPRLALMIDDEDSEVRLAAVWALGQIGGRVAAQAIALALKSDDPAMREAAKEALQELAFSADPLNVLR
ncbi:MAG TPA: HEAT repeat domain-containing protein [Chloroflexia bacterium]